MGLAKQILAWGWGKLTDASPDLGTRIDARLGDGIFNADGASASSEGLCFKRCRYFGALQKALRHEGLLGCMMYGEPSAPYIVYDPAPLGK